MKLSRTGIVNTLCCAIGVVLAYDLPWFMEAYRVLPPFIMELWRCVEVAQHLP